MRKFISDLIPATRAFPAASLLPAADVVVSAGGYHAWHEIMASGVPAVFLPQRRQYDSQHRRVRGCPVAETPMQLERMIRDLLGQARGPGRRFPDGAADVESRLQERVLLRKQIASMA